MDLAFRSRLLVKVPVAVWRAWGGARGEAAPGRILMYHGTPRRDAGALERQLRYLRRRYRVVPLASIAAQPARSNAIALTFDDGLRSNVAVAYPILKKLGLTATFFVCPALVDERRWLWNHEARARLRALGRREDEIERFIEQMKGLDLPMRQAVEQRLEDETPEYRPSAAEHEEYDLADWDELRGLDPEVVAIGSHTLTHPILPTLEREEAAREIEGSRALLEKRLGRPIDMFCYPNGSLDGKALELARRTYRLAVTAAPGTVWAGADPLLLPRLAAPRGLLRLALQLHP